MAVYNLSLRHLLVCLIALALMACSSLPRTQFTARQQAIAQIPGIPNARFWADAGGEDIRAAIRLPTLLAAAKRTGSLDVLALSGGGADGAFGAGILVGLTERRQRPQFTIVTGVSAGALIAPLAFLGSDYDGALKQGWTSGVAASLETGGFLSVLLAADRRRAALYDIVAAFADQDLLRRIAEEHRRGRRLLVVTSNLDAQRPVVWDIGAIAASGSPRALELVRNVLTASASVPGAFQPTAIEVEADGRRFSELHVDGGAMVQVLTIPEAVLAQGVATASPENAFPTRFFILANSRLKPEFEVVDASVIPVITRSYESLIKSQVRLTLIATSEFCASRNIGFYLAYIDEDFPAELKTSFETPYMRAMYRYGYEKAASGRAWHTQIPFSSRPPRAVEKIAAKQ
ncbi:MULTISPECIES: patatin-like phospholipase family protein [Rhodomicrobium]|uniref:patatin-like phospholipase family protein n=1 Tax=Rhodomicrobium TaxID=1068 RepID=UPI000B4AFFAC|nr:MULTISPECIES: patatin-like phospholipase family protein [Rhodomicrobium]